MYSYEQDYGIKNKKPFFTFGLHKNTVRTNKTKMLNIPLIEIKPSDNQEVWDTIIEVLYSSPEEFPSVLDWVSRCHNQEYRGPADFVFHESLKDAHILRIIKFANSVYTTYFDPQERLVVRNIVV